MSDRFWLKELFCACVCKKKVGALYTHTIFFSWKRVFAWVSFVYFADQNSKESEEIDRRSTSKPPSSESRSIKKTELSMSLDIVDSDSLEIHSITFFSHKDRVGIT